MTAVTPGQAAYEAFQEAFPGHKPASWEDVVALYPGERDAFESIGHAAIAAQDAQPAPDVCECTHRKTEHIDGRVECWASRNGAGQCPCTRYSPTTQPAPELAALRSSVTGLIGMWDGMRKVFTLSDGEWEDWRAALGRLVEELASNLDAIEVAAQDAQPAPGEELHALAAKWDATAARNQRNGQSLIDQGDEYGSEGLAVAEALGACVVELRAVLADLEPQPAPEPEARIARCPVESHDGEHFQIRTGDHWLCAIMLTGMLVAADLIADPAPGLAAAMVHIVTNLDSHRRHGCPTCLAGAEPELGTAMAETLASRDEYEQQLRHELENARGDVEMLKSRLDQAESAENDLLGLIAEMAAEWQRIGTNHDDDEFIAGIRQRAGLEAS